MWGVKFPMLGIAPGINFKPSRHNIFFKMAKQVKCFDTLNSGGRKEAKQYQVRGQTGVGWGQ